MNPQIEVRILAGEPMGKPDLEIKERIAELRKQGLETREIAKALSRSLHSILAHERRAGNPKRKRGRPPSPEIMARDKNVYLAFQRGDNPKAIAEKYNISYRHAFVIRNRESAKRKSKFLGQMK